MFKGIIIDQNLINKNSKAELIDFGINIDEVKGVENPKPYDNTIRCISIEKGLENFPFCDDIISYINQQLKDLLGNDLHKYKFILTLEKQENTTTKKFIEVLKKIIDNAVSIILTINIEEIKRDSIIFLNNQHWVYCEYNTPAFFECWKSIKRNDLGTIKKKYMFLNNHYSDIRFDILKFLYKNKFNNSGNISFNEILFGGQHINIDKDKFLNEIQHFGIEYPKAYDTIVGTSHFKSDTVHINNLLEINHATTTPYFNYRIFLESFFEIITETAPHLALPGVHISEKIFKPLRTALPFVYYGNPNLKKSLEDIGLIFNSPIYFFGQDKPKFFEHLKYILSKDFDWYHSVQLEYLNEYFHNMDKWNNFIRDNNKQILKFIYK